MFYDALPSQTLPCVCLDGVDLSLRLFVDTFHWKPCVDIAGVLQSTLYRLNCYSITVTPRDYDKYVVIGALSVSYLRHYYSVFVGLCHPHLFPNDLAVMAISMVRLQ